MPPDHFENLLESFLQKRNYFEAADWLEKLPPKAPSFLKTYFSIIMITKNRGDRIRDTLQALKAMAYPSSRFEIVVVDNGSSDNTAMVVQESFKNAPCRVTYVNQPTGCLCAARNAGIRAAAGDWIGFIDDDAICQPDWLLQYLYGRLVVPDAVAMGGTVEFPSAYRKPKWWRTRHSGLLSCKKGPTEISPLPMLDHPYGLNMWFDRSIFKRIGVFDERMDDWCPTIADETELFIRIQRENFPVIFVPKATVTHYVNPDRLRFKSLVRRAFLVGRSQKTLDWLYPEDVKIGVSLVHHLRRSLRRDLLGPLFIAMPIEISLWLGYHYQNRFLSRENR